MERQLADGKIICENLNQEIKKLKEENKSLKEQNIRLIKDNTSKKEELTKIKSENVSIKREYETQIDELNNQITEIKTSFNSQIANANDPKLLPIKQSSNVVTTLFPGETAFSVLFMTMGNQDIQNYAMTCKNTDLFVTLEEKLYNDYPKYKDYDTFFQVNTRKIKRFKTIEENNIKCNDIISIFIIEEN